MKVVVSLVAAFVFFVSGGVFAKDFKAGSIEIVQPWSRATPGGAAVAGGYMVIRNTGTQADRLVGGSSPVAGRFEIHEMAMSNGVMTMRPLAKGIEVKPQQNVELKPGGLHVMFMEIKQPFKQGDRVKATLVFEKAGPVEVEFSVETIGAKSGGHGSGH